MKEHESFYSYLYCLPESYCYPPMIWSLFLCSKYGDLAFFLSLMSKSQKKEFTNIISHIVDNKKEREQKIYTVYFETIIAALSRYICVSRVKKNYRNNYEKGVLPLLKKNAFFSEFFSLYFPGKYEESYSFLRKFADKGLAQKTRKLWQGHVLFHSEKFSAAEKIYRNIKENLLEKKVQLALIDVFNDRQHQAYKIIRELLEINWEQSFHSSLYLQSMYCDPSHLRHYLMRLEGALILKNDFQHDTEKAACCKMEKQNDISFKYMKVEGALRKGDSTFAIDLYRQLLKDNDQHSSHYYTINNLACLIAQQGEYSTSASLLQKCVQHDPSEAGFVCNLAQLYSRTDIHKMKRFYYYLSDNFMDSSRPTTLQDTPEPLLLLSKNDKMSDLYNMVEKISDSDVNILIHGENGTGKEIIARYIHSCSNRCHGPFVVIDCSAIPATLIESELFGYKKGAFTGAEKNKKGKLEKADMGTVYLDGITHIPFEIQAKLLNFIQSLYISPLGAEYSKKIDVRILASTNSDVMSSIENGLLREDLFFRLNVISVFLPPLRERTEDILSLYDHFINHFSLKYQINTPRITENIKNFLYDYHWPGNIRELQNFAERLVLLGQEEALTLQKNRISTCEVFEEIPTVHLKKLEMAAICKALNSSSTKKEAAKKLGINQSTLWRMLKRYNLKPQ